MDAKVLRGALSAAIRVTVSTTLIGCGGNVTSDAGRASTGTGGSSGATSTTSAGRSSGGAGVGGMLSGAGMPGAGESASASAPTEICGAAAAACLATLEQTPAAEAPDDAAQACCDTMLQELTRLRDPQAECYPDVYRRFMNQAVRHQCCDDPSTWQHFACGPWGPPVPPELSAAALRQWSGWV